MDRLRDRWREMPGPASLQNAIAALAAQVAGHGVFNMLLSDSRSLYCFRSTSLAFLTRCAPFGAATLIDEDLTLDFSRVTTSSDIVTLVATRPLTRDENWSTIAKETLAVFRDGKMVREAHMSCVDATGPRPERRGSPMRRFKTIDELESAVGEELGPSDWLPVTQEMIDRFAEATGDFQWIHVDHERAKHSPYGTTIAHGFLTLALLPRLRDQIYNIADIAARINYGCDKVRFLAPVPSGSRVRLRLKLARIESSRRGVRVDSACTIELEGAPRPALVADQIVLLLPA